MRGWSFFSGKKEGYRGGYSPPRIKGEITGEKNVYNLWDAYRRTSDYDHRLRSRLARTSNRKAVKLITAPPPGGVVVYMARLRGYQIGVYLYRFGGIIALGAFFRP